MKLLPVVTLTAILAQAAIVPVDGQVVPPVRSADLASRVLVVYNKMYRDSRAVADYYMAQRRIPAANKCAIDVESPGPNNYIGDGIAGYHRDIKEPIQKCLNKLGKENILYIVFSFMTPLRVWDAAFPGSARAVDSLVADLWNKNEVAPSGNPYYRHDTAASTLSVPFQTLQEFRSANPTASIYSVWRLDATDAALSKGLVDKAIAAAAKGLSGQGCFDRRYPALGADTAYGAGDWDIQRSADMVAAAGFPVTLDTNDAEFGTAPAPARCENAAFYGGWYSYGHYNDAFTWASGAMGWHLDSLSLENPHDPKTWSGGALARGITVTTGVVAEPYLDNIPHLDSFYKAVLEGAVVGDAMLRSTRALSWVNVNVGDPLYAPFALAPRLPAKAR